MTRKHFEAIAADLKRQADYANDVEYGAILDVCLALSHTFKEFNPAFDRDRFLKACGVE